MSKPRSHQKTTRVGPAKGRPMLSWVGKRALRDVPSFPAQHVETFEALPSQPSTGWEDWPSKYPRGGLLFHGDNKEVLGHLLANGFRGKVDLIYIDPPFDSGADYVRRVSLRGPKGTAKLEGESYSLGEQIQYTDIWANDQYLQFMYERLLLLKELLAPDGSLYLHCDTRKSHLLRCLLDEVLGSQAFLSEIVWQSSDAQSGANRYGPIHNTIFYYAPGDRRVWNDVRVPLSKATADSWYTQEEIIDAPLVNSLGVALPRGFVRRYNSSDLTARKPGGDTTYEWKGVKPPPGRYWAYSRSNMEEFERAGLLVYSRSGRPYLKRYLDENEGTPPQDVWTDVPMLRGISAAERSEYPTEKPERLLERIIQVSTDPGSLILDCFIGSGTTAAVAQRLGRRWIACDINKGALQTTSKRLQEIITAQLADAAQLSLEQDPGRPAQFAFTTWRINDYDLQVQHNEAVELACEHLGVTRTKTDSFFDGTRGRSLVKIVPFNHPLTPLDLDAVQRELEGRPDEGRPVTMVCFGMELASQSWVDDWNRLRRGRNAANRIDVIELRSDPRYGGVIEHRPAQADVDIRREGDEVVIEVKDFISPSVVQRLAAQTGIVTPEVTGWRSMVDAVMIDTDYDGKVFEIHMTDIPEKKSDFVDGSYKLPAAPNPDSRVAVKITDVLGEEVLVVGSV